MITSRRTNATNPVRNGCIDDGSLAEDEGPSRIARRSARFLLKLLALSTATFAVAIRLLSSAKTSPNPTTHLELGVEPPKDGIRPPKKRSVPTTTDRRAPPRVVALKYARGALSAVSLPYGSMRLDASRPSSVPLRGPRVQPDWYEPNAMELVDGYDRDACEPMYDWQWKSFLNCNSFHEIDWFRLKLINSG